MKKLIHFMKLAWSVSPMYILALVFKSLMGGAKMILNVVLPKLLIDEILGAKRPEMLIFFGSLIVLNTRYHLQTSWLISRGQRLLQ